MSRQFVDTNVWVYAVDAADQAKQAKARDVLRPAPGKDVVVSAQVLGEFYVTVTRKFADRLPEPDAVTLVEQMRKLTVVAVDADLVASAIANARAWGVSYWDALIVTAASASGCDVLLSEDLSHGRVFGAVRVENPFLELAGA